MLIVTAIIVGMTTNDVLKHYGSQQAAARALGIKQPSIARWGKKPPARRQIQIQVQTGGALMAEPGALATVLGIAKPV